MAPFLFGFLPYWTQRVDRGVLLLVAALFLVTILAHRYWRAVIRLEDELAARELDAMRSLDRYRLGFRALPYPAAFVDRASGLVMEAAPGWEAENLPEVGSVLFGEDPALADAWRAIAPPDTEHRAAAPVELTLAQAEGAFWAEPLHGASLGVVLVVRR